MAEAPKVTKELPPLPIRLMLVLLAFLPCAVCGGLAAILQNMAPGSFHDIGEGIRQSPITAPGLLLVGVPGTIIVGYEGVNRLCEIIKPYWERGE